jgi:hypothetical protein
MIAPKFSGIQEALFLEVEQEGKTLHQSGIESASHAGLPLPDL